MEKLVVIVGETAVGKTSLSIKLAKAFNGEIINGDAMQVYKGLDIVTDKAPVSKREGVPHHLFDLKEINEDYSVNEYQENVRRVIKEVNDRGHLPILVGGTGLYVKAALYDYTFNEESTSNKEVEEEYKDVSNEDLYKILLNIDEESTKNIHPNNRRRVLRAIAIAKSGITKSELIASQDHKMIYDALLIGLTNNKDIINNKIDARIEEMFNEGLIEEIKNNPTTSTASKAIGYQEVTRYLNNEISLEEAKELMKIHTHQYAKRQRTWYKHQFELNWITSGENAFIEASNLINDYLAK